MSISPYCKGSPNGLDSDQSSMVLAASLNISPCELFSIFCNCITSSAGRAKPDSVPTKGKPTMKSWYLPSFAQNAQ